MTGECVIDTNVIIALVLMYDSHHENCFQHVTSNSGDVWLPPKAKEEFDDKRQEIRRKMHREVSKHQAKVSSQFDGKLDRDDLRYIRNSVVDDGMKMADALRDYYDKIISERIEIDKLEIEYDLDDVDAEIDEDACEAKTGEDWRSVVSVWTRGVDNYGIASSLLIYEGDDPIICEQAHHIATETVGRTELGTADGDFIEHKEDEPRSRRDDILQNTNLDEITDLR